MTYKQARIFIDIETSANPEACAFMPEPIIEAPGNYKDPEKIAAYIVEKTEAAKASALDKAALDADYGQILSIGFGRFDGQDREITIVYVVGEIWKTEELENEDGTIYLHEEYLTETSLLEYFWKNFQKVNGNCIGYNILGFDLPYILRRSMALGVKVPVIPNLAKFRTEPVTDLMAILYNWGSDRYKGLKQVCKIYGIPNSCPDFDGSMVKNMTSNQLREYQESDIKLTMALYQRMNGIYFNH